MNNRDQKLGSGVLFVNDKKTTERHPDYTGTMTLDRDYRQGEQIKISGWRKNTPRNHLISLQVNTYKVESYPKPVGHDDNDVPF